MNYTNIISIYKMIFIYNAIMEGWTVAKTKTNQFSFCKKKEDIHEIMVEQYLDLFIKNNMNIKSIFNNIN